MNIERKSDFERSILKFWFKNYVIIQNNMNWVFWPLQGLT